MQQENQNSTQTKQQNQHLCQEQRQSRQEKINKWKEGIKKVDKKIKNSVHYRDFLRKCKKQTLKEIQSLKEKYQNAKQRKESDKSLIHVLQDYQNQQIKISQQIQQLEQQNQNQQQEIKQQYLLNRTIQEVTDYNSLVSANYNQLQFFIYKEDLILEGTQDQINDPQDSIALLEQQFTNNRKRIIKVTILYHNYFSKQQKKIQQYTDTKIPMEEKKKGLIKKLNELSQLHEDNLREQNKKEKALRELNEKKQELEQQCVHLKNYIELRKEKQQIYHQKAQLDTIIQKKQQVNQKILSIYDQIRTSTEDAGEEIYKNIQDDNQDFKNYTSDFNNKVNQFNQFVEDRYILIKNQNQAQNQIREDKSEEKILQLLQIIEKHTPQIKRFSEQEVLKSLGERNQKIDYIQEDKKVKQNCLDTLKKSIEDIQNKQKELQIKLSDIDKTIKNTDIMINTYKQNDILINIKLNELRQKLTQNPQQLIQDINKFNADFGQLLEQISEMYTNIIDGEIRQKYQETVSYILANGANKPENIHQKDYKRTYERNQIDMLGRLQTLKDRENKINQEVIKIKQTEESHLLQIQINSKQVRKLKKSIIRLQSKQRVYKKKIERRWELFYQYEKQKLDYQKYLKVGKLD